MLSRRLRIVFISSLALAVSSVALFSSSALAGSGKLVSVSKISSAPKGATGGHTYRLHGRVTNDGKRGSAARVTVSLAAAGKGSRSVGSARVGHVSGRSSRGFAVRVRIPAGLKDGRYSIVACARHSGSHGSLACANAARKVTVGSPGSVRGTQIDIRKKVPSQPCSDFADNTAANSQGTGSGPGFVGQTTAGNGYPGGHTLSENGETTYQEVGNTGYTSNHMDVNLQYDTTTNMLLPGSNVVHTNTATQDLCDFTYDFERTSLGTSGIAANMTISSIEVNGVPALGWAQVRPGGSPNGAVDKPGNATYGTAGYQAGTAGTGAMSLETSAANSCSTIPTEGPSTGQLCKATKLKIMPATAIPNGQSFTVKISYAGRPGTHRDPDSSSEGWFNAGGGSFVTAEPIGTQAWMPVNNHPLAKPSVDFRVTGPPGKIDISNGELISYQDNAPDANFPSGSRTWHWNSEPIASYLMTTTMGDYDLTERIGDNGVQYYIGLSSSFTASNKDGKYATVNQLEDLTRRMATFYGTYPFTSAGVLNANAAVGFVMELQTKISFPGGVSLGTLWHEQGHQWWGDSVSTLSWRDIWQNEGTATFSGYLQTAMAAEDAAGGPYSAPGQAAFDSSVNGRFNTNYAATGSGWTTAPSKVLPSGLFSTGPVYTRWGTGLIALRQILGKTKFVTFLTGVQREYRYGSAGRQAYEAYAHKVAKFGAACDARLTLFFQQWLDTAYASTTNTAANRPMSGPGLNLPPSGTLNNTFYNDGGGGCV